MRGSISIALVLTSLLLVDHSQLPDDGGLGSWAQLNRNFRIADLHVSLCQEETHDASGALGERALRGSGSFTAHECLSAGGPCIPAGPDIHLLSQARRAVTDD